MKIDNLEQYREALDETGRIYDAGRALEDLDRLVVLAFAVKAFEDENGVPDIPDLGKFE